VAVGAPSAGTATAPAIKAAAQNKAVRDICKPPTRNCENEGRWRAESPPAVEVVKA
jgi:hypothetical protein